jgi:diguanylate cyclase (GGDEF)-like protein
MTILPPAFLITTGIIAYTGLQSGILGISGRRGNRYLAFALACGCAAVYQFATCRYYSAGSVEEAVSALHWQALGAIFYLPAFFWFVALYTGQRDFQRWLMGVAAAAGVFVIVEFALPVGFRFSSLEVLGTLDLPWNERLAHYRGEPHVWNVLSRIVHTAFSAWAIARTVILYRQGIRRPAVLLAVYLVLAFAAEMWGVLIDWGIVYSFYVAGFAFFAMSLLMSVSIATVLREQAAALRKNTRELNAEMDQRRAAEGQVHRMAYQDYLTSLPNRRSLHEHVDRALDLAGRSGRPCAMLLIDLDHFKTINDSLGHDVGDEVLCAVAMRLSHVADPTAFCARLGGDEFVMVLQDLPPDVAEAEVRALAERITTAFAQPIEFGERIFVVGASVGAALARDGSVTDLLRRTDLALYRAKALGRGNVQFFLPGMDDAVDLRLRLERGLRSALANHEMALHFQPVVNADGEIFGAEALLRWHSPELGLVEPAQFIPVAEETGLIHDIGEWVLRRACDQLVAWERAGVPFHGHLSVNVSPWQFARPDFVALVRGVFEERAVAPERMVLEVTESALLYDTHETIGKLVALRAAGIRVALDDFGTGYASLSHLKDLPLDMLKIDKSFVDELTAQPRHPVVRAMIALGHEMDLVVVTEGVETQDQYRILLQEGCAGFQGFLFCPPLPPEDFARWVTQERAPGAASGSLFANAREG